MTQEMQVQELINQKEDSRNFKDDELILSNYKCRCQSLEMQKTEMLRIREKLQKINIKNDHTSNRLLKLKAEFELHKADLSKTLFSLKLANDKQEILCKKKVNNFLEKRKNLDVYLKTSPLMLELEELIRRNNHLKEQFKKESFLLNLTKNQYEENMRVLLKTFKMKVCEFCDTALKLKAVND